MAGSVSIPAARSWLPGSWRPRTWWRPACRRRSPAVSRGIARGAPPPRHLRARLLLELERLAEAAGALAAHLSDSLAVSYHSDDFAEAQEARQALAAVGALCATLRRTASDAQEWAAGIDGELPGLVFTDDF